MNNIVSIIIPVYNTQKFLPNLLKKLSLITYKKIQIIFVNDHSTDNSQKIIKKFCDKDKRAILIDNKTNIGVSTCRNIGIKKSYGDYIYFVDSDDLFNPHSINMYINCMLKYNVDLVTSRNKSFDFDSDIECYTQANSSPKNGKIKIITSNDKFIASFLTTNFTSESSPLVCWNKLLKKSIIKKIKNYPDVFDNKLSFCEDLEFMFKYLYLSKKICTINKIYYFHRERSGSIIHSNFNEKWFDHIKCFKTIDAYNLNQFKLTKNNINSLKCQFAFLLLNKMQLTEYNNHKNIEWIYKIFKNNLKFTIKTYKHFSKKFFILKYIKAHKYYKKLILK